MRSRLRDSLGNGPVSQSHTQDIKAEASGAAIAAQPGGWGSVTCTSWERTRWGERGGERGRERVSTFVLLWHSCTCGFDCVGDDTQAL